MVKLREYLPIDFEDLKKLHALQESSSTAFLSVETLPKIGFMVQYDAQPVAFGFLRRLEGGYAQFDTFVTDPKASPEHRNEALNLLTEKLINEAKVLELRGVYAISSDVSVIRRAVETGFVLLPQYIVGLSLR